MASIQATASKMIGPLPLGAWVLVVGAGVGVVVWQRRAGGSVEPTDDGTTDYPLRDNSMPPGVGVGGSGMWTDLSVPTTGNPNNAAVTITTNDQWVITAINRAIADGIDPITAAWALNRYIAGLPLDSQGDAIVRDIMRKIGAPPQPVGATDTKPVQVPTPGVQPPVVPPPVVKPPVVKPPVITLPVQPPSVTGRPYTGLPFNDPKEIENMLGSITDAMGITKPPAIPTVPKATYKVHTVKKGETMAIIANKYRITWGTLYNANRGGIRRPDGGKGTIYSTANLKAGSILIIPGR